MKEERETSLWGQEQQKRRERQRGWQTERQAEKDRERGGTDRQRGERGECAQKMPLVAAAVDVARQYPVQTSEY